MNLNQNLDSLILLFVIYSFLGWIIETFFKSVQAKRFVNSGFLSGPFCPVYGFGALLVLQSRQLVDGAASIVDPTTRTVVSVILAIMGTTALEYLTGMLLEKIFNRKWWDYSEERFNLQGRICLKYSVYWGILAYLMLEFIHPSLISFVNTVPMNVKYLLAGIIMPYFMFDLINSVENALETGEHRSWPYLRYSWKRRLREYLRLPSAFSRLSLAITDKVTYFGSSLNEKWRYIRDIEEYRNCIHYVIHSAPVERMKQIRHHGHVTCFEHSLNVSFYSFMLCRALGLDYKAAARAGLLHDLFLYDWRTTRLSHGKHAFVHPRLALNNASAVCLLNEVEKDIILKHMFPLTWQLPSYKESWIVCLVDKCCACAEIADSIFSIKQRSYDYTNAIR
ncbi:MAG: HD domain-containing protein [Syntrophothermus sp.]|uniref:putative ABC transporter permease n=1 Tax=Syntrophothermus sp. TaxID=2736299 RepID=UPI00257F21E3|nr:HD domain-containing protein [Syntrophothermus sp.]NSW83129.1 HD domain-containing protein [Syntrophothermus sp.]